MRDLDVANRVRELVGEPPRQRRNVLDALAQWRDADGEEVEAIEQVIPERPGRDRLIQVPVHRGDDAE